MFPGHLALVRKSYPPPNSTVSGDGHVEEQADTQPLLMVEDEPYVEASVSWGLCLISPLCYRWGVGGGAWEIQTREGRHGVGGWEDRLSLVLLRVSII